MGSGRRTASISKNEDVFLLALAEFKTVINRSMGFGSVMKLSKAFLDSKRNFVSFRSNSPLMIASLILEFFC